MGPTIFTGVKNSMRTAGEEVFGPVLTVIPFDTDDEAVEIANDTPYGLAAALWTTSIERAVKLPKRLQAGTAWVNAYRVVSYLAPFGGVKGSGMGAGCCIGRGTGRGRKSALPFQHHLRSAPGATPARARRR